MKCDECLPLIEEYFDGELEGESKRAIAAHLDTCALCSGALEELRADHAVYASAQTELEVDSELWNSVRSRIAESAWEKHKARRDLRGWLNSFPAVSAWAAAGMVVAAIVLTVAVMKYNGMKHADSEVASNPAVELSSTPAPSIPASRAPSEEPSQQPQGQGSKESATARVGAVRPRMKLPASVSATVNRAKSPDQLVREAEQKYLTAIAMLSRNVARRRSHLDHETLARFQQALSSVDRSIADTRRAVRQHPEDPLAVQYMLTAYSRKVDVLREMADY